MKLLSKVYEFLKECECFYLLTINGDFPAGRPFGAIIEENNYLYIATHDKNKVHLQLRKNGNIQLIAKKDDSRDWIRITGIAKENNTFDMKQKMLNECPVLQKYFSSPKDKHYLLFQIKVLNTQFN